MNFNRNQLPMFNDNPNEVKDSRYYTTGEFNDNFSNAQDSFNILHINSRSLNNNFDSLVTLLTTVNNFPFSVIGVTETWLHSNSAPLFHLNNYHMVRVDRPQGRRGGGVALYISDQLQFNIRHDIAPNECESLFIEIDNIKTRNIVVGVIYRPPNSNFEQFYEGLDRCLNLLAQENKQIYLIGDFNINLLPDQRNNSSDRFQYLLQSNSFQPHITQPTRIDPTSSTLIDNIFSNITDRNVTGGLLYFEVSDHLPIFTVCPQKMSSRSFPEAPMYRKETENNINSLISDLALETWLDIYSDNDPEVAYQCFHQKIVHYYNKNIPLIKPKQHNTIRKPWITKGIFRSIQRRNHLYKIYIRTPTNSNLNEYKKYRNLLTNIIRTSRKSYYTNKLKTVKSNTKSTWAIINDILGKKNTSVTNKKFIINGTETTNNNDIAENFNSYFVNVGSNLASRINNDNANFTQFLPQPFNKSLFLYPTSPDEIINITKSLNSGKSQGHDGLSSSLLKQIIYVIASPLAHIFNLSMSCGVCPKLLKIAKVIPIYKKDDPQQISNYRPISILPSISKILEKIIHNRLYTFVTTNNLLSPNQYGFRKNHSTDLAVVELYDKITNAMAEKQHVIGIFMDLSKAFDTLNHDILLYKLKTYGIRGTALSWFKDYLSNRQQFTSYNGVNSDFLTVKCGVPQGSILGPLLFLLYINDISEASNRLSYILFADDTNIFFSHRKLDVLANTLNRELPKVSSWFKCNKLSLNINKTNFIHFKQSNLNENFPYNINIDGLRLEQKTCTKFLGVLIDENLNWNQHIHNITTAISKGIGILLKLKEFLPSDTLFLLYNTLILPHITYCNIVWATCCKTRINSILLLQKKALRICTNSNYLAHTNPLFHRLKTLNVFDINKFQTAIFMFKYTNNQLPAPFDNLFTLNRDVHSYPTRNSQNYHLVNPKLLISHKSIRHHGPDIWNSLTKSVKACTTLFSFKATLKNELISCYNIHE